METKKCSQCGVELPLSEFKRSGKSKDGYMNVCNSCRDGNRKRMKISPLVGVGNPDLARFKPRELIEELRFRGYRGKLTFMQEISL